jgi:hypothetical protein
MSLSLSPNSLYRQTTDCTEGALYMWYFQYKQYEIVVVVIKLRFLFKDDIFMTTN